MLFFGRRLWIMTTAEKTLHHKTPTLTELMGGDGANEAETPPNGRRPLGSHYNRVKVRNIPCSSSCRFYYNNNKKAFGGFSLDSRCNFISRRMDPDQDEPIRPTVTDDPVPGKEGPLHQMTRSSSVAPLARPELRGQGRAADLPRCL